MAWSWQAKRAQRGGGPTWVLFIIVIFHHHHHHHDNCDHHCQHHQVKGAQTAGPLPGFQFGRCRLLAVQLISSPAPAYSITFSVWGLKTHKQTNKQLNPQTNKQTSYLSTCCVYAHAFKKSPLSFSALSSVPKNKQQQQQ